MLISKKEIIQIIDDVIVDYNSITFENNAHHKLLVIKCILSSFYDGSATYYINDYLECLVLQDHDIDVMNILKRIEFYYDEYYVSSCNVRPTKYAIRRYKISKLLAIVPSYEKI